MYLPNPDVQPTGAEIVEFLDAPPDPAPPLGTAAPPVPAPGDGEPARGDDGSESERTAASLGHARTRSAPPSRSRSTA